MPIAHTRLDRFIIKKCQVNRREAKLMLAKKRITVDGVIVDSPDIIINKFSQILLDGDVLQAHTPLYIMLHKPIGVVSATKDDKHQTVLDLIDHPRKHELHIVGRLDLNTSGLVLLTNDSRWSERLMSPTNKVNKTYLVTLANPIDESYVSAFARGMYFDYEDITTLPATLHIISDYQAEVVLVEGKYHQIKRMFGRFSNPVVALYRRSVGSIKLDENLSVGASRELTEQEVNSC